MSSTEDPRLARISEAIEAVAHAARSPDGRAGAEDLADRVAGIWAMVAEADPALASRLPGYCTGEKEGATEEDSPAGQDRRPAGQDRPAVDQHA